MSGDCTLDCLPLPQCCLQVTYADFAVALMTSGMIDHAELGACVDKFPKIRALQQAVENLPKIKEWIEKRPKTDF